MKIKYIKSKDELKSIKDITFVNYYQDDVNIIFEDKSTKVVNIKIDKNITERVFIRKIRKGVLESKTKYTESVFVNFKELLNTISKESFYIESQDKTKQNKIIQNIITNILLAAYKFENYKTTKTNKLKNIFVLSDDQSIINICKEGEVYGHWSNFARDLSNTPGNDMTPEILAKKAESIFLKNKNKNIKVKVVSEKECKKLGMNLFCAVGQGSSQESKLIVIEYFNGPKNEDPIVFVGKGITFDTGGLNVKTQKMEEMIMDMTGGGTVISAMGAIVDFNIKKNIIAIVPAVENALSGSSYRPGDIIKSLSDITVEIGNTDAEGRLVMADSITYSEKYSPRIIIDVATLTGASLVALGEKASGLISFDNHLKENILNISEANHEYMYPLPAWQEYREDIKSNVADIININNKKAYGAGAVTAGMFLYEFVEDLNKKRNIKDELKGKSKENNKTQNTKEKQQNIIWAHIDIAPRMTSNYQDNLESGAAGEPVKTLIDIAKFL